jgi:preprotein translocase subunit YajC
METILQLLAQAPAPAGSPWKVWAFFLGMMGVFYIVLFVPRQREVKRHREMVAGIQKGDTVVMAGGIIGDVQMIRENQITLRSGTSTLLVERQRVVRKVSGKTEGK